MVVEVAAFVVFVLALLAIAWWSDRSHAKRLDEHLRQHKEALAEHNQRVSEIYRNHDQRVDEIYRKHGYTFMDRDDK